MINTVVTAFIDIGNGNRSIEKYIEYGKQLMNVDIDQITFIERDVFNTYFSVYGSEILTFLYEGKEYAYTEVGNKTFVFFEKEDIYLYNYSINKYIVYTSCPIKDTSDYMFIQCHKTEWIKMATELKKDRESFIWIDFGIFHMIQDEEQFRIELERMKHREHNSVRIAITNYLNTPFRHLRINDPYTDIMWYFAGSVFGGSRQCLVEFANRMKEKCLQIIAERETIMWELNIWYFIYHECPELFDCYKCKHSISILSRF